MNARQAGILDYLSRHGEAGVRELADRFGVSLMTVRRDLAYLENQGNLTRTHGGSVLSKQSVLEFAFREKEATNAAQKQAIARAVAESVEPGMTLSLDTGTTTLEVARAIAPVPQLTVLTSSLAIASALFGRDNIELVLLGGTARKGSPDLFGMLTEDNLKQFLVDMAVLGADGVTREGVYTTDVAIARVSQAMIAGATRTVLAIDSSKFDRTAFVKVTGWSRITRVVTDAGTPPSVRKWLSRSVRETVYAEVT